MGIGEFELAPDLADGAYLLDAVAGGDLEARRRAAVDRAGGLDDADRTVLRQDVAGDTFDRRTRGGVSDDANRGEAIVFRLDLGTDGTPCADLSDGGIVFATEWKSDRFRDNLSGNGTPNSRVRRSWAAFDLHAHKLVGVQIGRGAAAANASSVS